MTDPKTAEPLYFVFDGPPSPEGPRFIECETADGRSVCAGEWREREDGRWALIVSGREVTKTPLAHEMEQSAIAAIVAASSATSHVFDPKTAEVKAVPSGWRTMESAPKDRTPVRALIHADLYPRVKPGRDDLVRWNGQEIVVHHPGIADDGFDTGWSLSAPVGHGGFPDEWFVGWRPTGIAASPPAETGEGFAGVLAALAKVRPVNVITTPRLIHLDDDETGAALFSVPTKHTAYANLLWEVTRPEFIAVLQGLSAQPVSPSEGEVVHVGNEALFLKAHDALELVRNHFRANSEGVSDDVFNAVSQALYAIRARPLIGLAHPASDQSDTERMRAALVEISTAFVSEEVRTDYRGREFKFRSCDPKETVDVAIAALAGKAADK